jgi:hypothetical protein
MPPETLPYATPPSKPRLRLGVVWIGVACIAIGLALTGVGWFTYLLVHLPLLAAFAGLILALVGFVLILFFGERRA